ncbi:CCA tRNA nucleotidyltransferase [Candidatus Bathyarchaeota archaeon]|nr:CCA tRNA nucleotidyltransferase [Candidatus Bathyarchaeota archaeon]
MSSIEKVCFEVTSKVTPSQQEREKIMSLTKEIISKLSVEAERENIKAEIRIEGSIAKDTWLKGEADIDIFMRVPLSLTKEDLEVKCLNVAREAFKEYKIVERYAEHPYLEVWIKETRVNIVPCFKVEKGRWLSATDRTPFHTDFMKEKLNEALRKEVRILKKFMKGTGLYGAEIKIGGFSGFLCEILTLYYGSFKNVLEAASNWRRRQLIDVAEWFKGREEEAYDLFDENLIVVDPVDKSRNAAASIFENKLWEFVSASRIFLKKPSLKFFYPPSQRILSEKEASEKLLKANLDLLFLVFSRIDTVVDVLWGQLYKTENALKNFLKTNSFEVIRSASWSDEKELNIILFELERKSISSPKKHMGPPVEKRKEAENFLFKHLYAEDTVAGPWIEGDRWFVEKKRRWDDAKKLLSFYLSNNGGRSIGVASKIAEKLKKNGFQIFFWVEARKFYEKRMDFAQFISRFIEGRPIWLE